ncbi:MAG TPA: hypothetical protein VGO45_06715 [Bacteroidia bacterium]|jgi:lipopolysaccharide export LptBFGC system permease protein LptF|nr:hypothetical protein [Bacteroidia bacterium]
MKKKIPLYAFCLALIAIPFYIAYLSPSPSFAANLASFLSVLAGFLILIIFGSTDGQAG